MARVNIMISPWKGGTPRRLCNELDLKLFVPKEIREGRITPMKVDNIINWGCSLKLNWGKYTLNPPGLVAIASNKLSTFRVLRDNKIPTVEFSTDIKDAQKWMQETSIIVHQDVHGHSGSGLVLCKRGTDSLVNGTVYTKYFPKKDEARVHVFRDGAKFHVLYLLKKRINPERFEEFGIDESPTTFIRTYENGWIFARNVVTDKKAVDLAQEVIRLIGLDFGAVDIMSKGSTYVVGEVNTAPGLEGAALEFYVKHLRAQLAA